MPYNQLRQWMAYSMITGPIGQDRDDILFAMIAASICNANRKKNSAPISPEKLMPYKYTNEELDEQAYIERLKNTIREHFQ